MLDGQIDAHTDTVRVCCVEKKLRQIFFCGFVFTLFFLKTYFLFLISSPTSQLVNEQAKFLILRSGLMPLIVALQKWQVGFLAKLSLSLSHTHTHTLSLSLSLSLSLPLSLSLSCFPHLSNSLIFFFLAG